MAAARATELMQVWTDSGSLQVYMCVCVCVFVCVCVCV